MEEKTSMRYVDTNTASVKMTGGVPFSGSVSGSSIEDEIDNFNYHDDSSNYGDSAESNRSPAKNSASQKLVTSARSSGNSEVFTKDDLGTSDLKRNNPEQILHKIINERLNLHYSSPESSSYKDINDSVSGIKVLRKSEYSKTIILGQNNAINQDVPSNLNSSEHKSDTIIDTETSHHTLKLNSGHTQTSQTISTQRFDTAIRNKTPGTSSNSDRSITKLHYSDHMQAGVGEMAKNRLFSTRPAKPSSDSHPKFLTIKSSSPPSQYQSARLSQSLENSQEGVLRQWEDGMITSNSMSAITSDGQKLQRRNRENPFNNDILIDEDHFSNASENFFHTDRRSTNSTKSSSASQGPDWWQEQSDISFAELGLSEDHFSHPQGHFGLSRAEELELAIENCKELIREAAPGSDKQKNMVLKLVQLRIKQQEVKEGPEPLPDNVKVIMSHKMMLKSSRTSKYYCERCNGSIWGMLQVWYRCTECGYRCHEKCLQQILRTCAKAKVLENPTVVTEICPKEASSLAGQNYRCWECRLAISFKSGHSEPRLCDYVGRYYCEFCHWNDTFVIPARVLHSWDFIPRKVSRSSKQFLKLMQKKAVIRIQDINPMLFVYVDQLNEIKKLREEMMIMKKYILSCPNAMLAKLLLLLENRQHFVECSDRYSMQDLLDAEDALLPELVNVHSTWGQHIKVDCELCQGRGFCCELCGDKEVLFPFDSIAVVCARCSTVLHRHCFAKANLCPRCERRGKRENLKS